MIHGAQQQDESGMEVLLEKGILSPLDIHFAALMGRLGGSEAPELLMAAALVSSCTRQGHICLDCSLQCIQAAEK